MLVPATVSLAGLALYFFANPKLTEIGRLLFFVGAFWLVYLFSHGRIHLYGPS